MDLNDIWQEHKVWILGVLGGIVVFLIARGFIASHWDTGRFEGTIRGARATLTKKTFYGRTERGLADNDRKSIDEELKKVEAKAYFTPRPAFDLEGKGDATLHYVEITSKVKTAVQDAMDTASVDFSQQQLGLPVISPTDRDETQKTLVALDIVDDAIGRLLDASDRVNREVPDSFGLRALDQIQIDVKSKAPRRGGMSRKGRKSQVDLGEQVRVRIRFHADSNTLRVFLESLVTEGKRPLLLEEIVASNSERSGEPMQITCRFLALLRQEV